MNLEEAIALVKGYTYSGCKGSEEDDLTFEKADELLALLQQAGELEAAARRTVAMCDEFNYTICYDTGLRAALGITQVGRYLAPESTPQVSPHKERLGDMQKVTFICEANKLLRVQVNGLEVSSDQVPALLAEIAKDVGPQSAGPTSPRETSDAEKRAFFAGSVAGPQTEDERAAGSGKLMAAGEGPADSLPPANPAAPPPMTADEINRTADFVLGSAPAPPQPVSESPRYSAAPASSCTWCVMDSVHDDQVVAVFPRTVTLTEEQRAREYADWLNADKPDSRWWHYNKVIAERDQLREQLRKQHELITERNVLARENTRLREQLAAAKELIERMRNAEASR